MKFMVSILLGLNLLVQGTVLPASSCFIPNVTIPLSPAAQTDTAPAADLNISAPSAILMEASTGAVVYEKNSHEARHPASVTKIMTLLLTFEALEAGKVSLSDIVPVSEHAYHMGGSQIWLEPGEQLTLDEMLKAICISSANDAAVAVAEFIGGSEPVFVERMNARAKELGMQSTTFRNACGLDEDGHLSTARDVAIMSREMLLNHPEIENYCTVWMDTLRGGATQLVNTNKLLKSYNGITGLKTGTTGKAGVCISASASRDDLRLIAVVLGSSSGKERFAAATSLLDYGFAMFESALVPIPADAPKTLPVQKGEEPALELCYTAPERCLAVKGQGSSLQAEVELPQTLEAPIREGSVIGSLNIKNSQGILQSCPIIAAKTVDARSFSGCFRRVVNALWLTA